jgi:Ca2+-binding EF-hand superfamily protein
MASPKAKQLEKELKTLPHDELERLLMRMGPSSPIGYPPDPNKRTGDEKLRAILPHASSTMYTEKQHVDSKKSYDDYVKKSIRNGLKQPLVHDETDPENWKSLYSTTFKSKDRDTLEIFTEQNIKVSKQEDMDEYWGYVSNPTNIVSRSVDAIDVALKEKVAIFSRFRYNPLATLSQIFTDFDTMHTGKITESDFVQAVGLKLNFMEFSNELRALYRRHDIQHLGELDSETFINSLFDQDTTQASYYISKIRELLEIQPGGFYALKAALSRCGMEDKQGVGVLNPQFMETTLNTILAHHKIKITSEEYRRLFRPYADGYGNIQYKKLLFGIRGYMNETRRALVLQAFGTFDKDQWGRVVMRTIRNRYDTTEHPVILKGMMSKTEAEYEFISRFDKRDDQPVSESEFLEFYNWVSANIPGTLDFLDMVRTPWHLKGEEVDINCRRVLVWHSNGGQEIFQIDADLGMNPSKQSLKHFLTKEKGVQDIAEVKIV